MNGAEPSEPAGDPSCWLAEVCDECGGIDHHRDDCPIAGTDELS